MTKKQTMYDVSAIKPVYLRVADPNAPTTENTPATGDTYTREQYEQALSRARTEERTRLQASIEHEKAEALRIKTELDAVNERQRQAEIARLAPDEQLARRMGDLENQLSAANSNITQMRIDAQNERRALELVAYRERCIREYKGQIYPNHVFGQDEAAIETSAEEAHKEWLRVKEEARQEALAEIARTQTPVVQQPQVQQPPQGPQAYVVPGNPFYPAPVHGFPSVTNPQPVAEGAPILNVQELTSEQAVRSGKYNGELRNQMLAHVRGAGPVASFGSQPRHLAPPVGYQQGPGGVLQPQGNPTGQVANPQYAPQQVFQQPVQQQQPYIAPMPQQAVPQGVDPVVAARAAVARTHSGQNPLLGDPANSSVNSAVRAGEQHAANPQAAYTPAYAARFNPTPPVGNA